MIEHTLTYCIVGLAGIAWIFLYEFPRLRCDNFRSDIRRIRDNLFDSMWENGYDFSDPAYVQTRQALNGLLQWSNSLSFVTFFVGFYFAGKATHEGRFPRSKNLNLQERLDHATEEAAKRIIAFVFLEGFTGIAVRVLGFAMKAINRWNRLRHWATHAGKSLVLHDAIAFAIPSQRLAHH